MKEETPKALEGRKGLYSIVYGSTILYIGKATDSVIPETKTKWDICSNLITQSRDYVGKLPDIHWYGLSRTWPR